MANLTLENLQQAVCGTAAAFRCRTELQPAGGAGTKVFPPTYAGAVYATERRRLPGHEEPVPCVLLDSVQSQANRMEEALQQAVDDGRLKLPVVEVDFGDYFPGEGKDDSLQLLDPVGKISALQAPHRIADAILRDSVVSGEGDDNEKPFRDDNLDKESSFGNRLRQVGLRDATVLFELCPTALLFGMWDSTGPKGGLGAKFERAMVSEIVGIDAVYGVKTSSRIDPLAIQKDAGPLYEGKDGDWTLDPKQSKQEKKKPKTLGKDGRPSEANHGNIVPSLSDVNRDSGEYLAGGVTIAKAEQTIVLSLPALRRLRFPNDEGESSPDRDNAARTVLAALGLCAAALADDAGLDLRSRCLLYPGANLTWDLLNRKSGGQYTLPAEEALKLFQDAVEAAKNADLPWREEPLTLKPSEQLVKLVVKSQQLAAQQGGSEE
ncbi:MAG: type I-U CRISPR-associated protein Cas7 [Pirellulales bacterium]|nr:type I-U CRISPR-associated protein Cas7 [Pirellulales bacterium]